MKKFLLGALISLLTVFTLSAHAEMNEEFFVAPDLPPNSQDCQTLVVTQWMELQAGESYELELDMQGCEASHYYTYYGHFSKKKSSPLISSKDGIVLKLYDSSTGKEYESDTRVSLTLENPEHLILTVTNTNKRRSVRTRISFQDLD